MGSDAGQNCQLILAFHGRQRARLSYRPPSKPARVDIQQSRVSFTYQNSLLKSHLSADRGAPRKKGVGLHGSKHRLDGLPSRLDRGASPAPAVLGNRAASSSPRDVLGGGKRGGGKGAGVGEMGRVSAVEVPYCVGARAPLRTFGPLFEGTVYLVPPPKRLDFIEARTPGIIESLILPSNSPWPWFTCRILKGVLRSQSYILCKGYGRPRVV